ncbi:MAG TPA: S53 family peptidase [Candidatus Limnocylindrales bacterium]|nr:S53 family peptidase [Candidatus Limnocylindrales bacterium]
MTLRLSMNLRTLPLLLLACLGIFSAEPAIADRIPQAIDNTSVWRLRGSVPPIARPEFDRGKVNAALPMQGMKLVFRLTPTQQSSLDTLLRQQLDPASANYHRWLTPEQYADRFSLSATDTKRAARWLRQQGFTNVTPARSRTWIAFSGRAGQVESAFRTPIHQYVVNGNTHYANTGEPSLPGAFRGVVLGIGALNDFRPKPRGIVKSVHPNFTSEISGKHFLAPDDFATIYDIQGLYGSGTTGAGQTIAVVGQSDLSTDTNHNNQYDVLTFRSVSNLPTVNLQVVLVPGDKDPGIVSGDVDETNLDLEWAGAVAKDASLIYVNSQNALFNAMQYAVDQNLAPVISVSYGLCEAQFSSTEIGTLTALTQQANAQGQTIVASSGDSGPADCDFSTDPNNPVKSATHGYAVDVPASLPNVTGMGGTEFSEGDTLGATQYWSGSNNGNNGSALSYIPEMVWNDTVTDGSLSASGGGVSKLFSKPPWQTGAGVPADGQRDVPDVSLSSSADHDGYLICSQSSCVTGYRKSDQTLTVIGGTSVAAPTFAGIVALIVQKTNDRQGNVNQYLYSLAASSPNAFHDITTGDNMVPCTQGSTDCPASGMIGYSAGPGYDLTTGLGSVDAAALVAAWNGPTNPDFQISAQSQSLTVTRGTPVTDTLTVTGLAGFSQTVNLSCVVSSTLTGTTCSVSPSSVAPGGTATLTVTASPLAGMLRVNPLFLHPGGWMETGFAFAAGLLLTRAKPTRTRRKQSGRWSAMLMLLLIGILTLTTSCGGGSSSSQQASPPPAPQSGTVTVQASSGDLNHNLSIAVTVN